MLIHPWDATLGPEEWQDWLASTDRFGALAVNNLDPTQAPLVLPLHFTVAGDAEIFATAAPIAMRTRATIQDSVIVIYIGAISRWPLKLAMMTT